VGEKRAKDELDLYELNDPWNQRGNPTTGGSKDNSGVNVDDPSTWVNEDGSHFSPMGMDLSNNLQGRECCGEINAGAWQWSPGFWSGTDNYQCERCCKSRDGGGTSCGGYGLVYEGQDQYWIDDYWEVFLNVCQLHSPYVEGMFDSFGRWLDGYSER
jgi:hypothetical protein